MRKQVKYHPHNIIYGSYGGRVFPLFACRIWRG